MQNSVEYDYKDIILPNISHFYYLLSANSIRMNTRNRESITRGSFVVFEETLRSTLMKRLSNLRGHLHEVTIDSTRMERSD